MFALFPQFPQP